MINEILERRSIRKFKKTKIDKEIIEKILYAATCAPSAKNRQPWKFLVFTDKSKEKLIKVMEKGICEEKKTHRLMPVWANSIGDAENTVKVMKEASCLVVILNTNSKNPFLNIEKETRIVEICDSLSIGAAVENMILTALHYGLGSLWIANTCYAYDDLINFLNTEDQLVGIVALGLPNEKPEMRPRKEFSDVVKFM